MWRRFLSHSAIRGAVCQTNASVQAKRCDLFDEELMRQQTLESRMRKIEVQYIGVPQNCTLVMNKHSSTPYDCLRHVSQRLCELSVLAEVDGQPWDMHRPLTNDCQLRCLFFHDKDPYIVNKAFWRSCSIMLGSVLEMAFSRQHYVQLHSFPSPKIHSGSFVYDVDMSDDNWSHSESDLRSLSALMIKQSYARLMFRRLVVDEQLANKIFADNKHKLSQVSSIARASDDGLITLYRIGKFIDMSRGPVISHTGLLGRCSIMAAHNIDSDFGRLTRYQGVALPSSTRLKHFTYAILENRAKNPNLGPVPVKSVVES